MSQRCVYVFFLELKVDSQAWICFSTLKTWSEIFITNLTFIAYTNKKSLIYVELKRRDKNKYRTEKLFGWRIESNKQMGFVSEQVLLLTKTSVAGGKIKEKNEKENDSPRRHMFFVFVCFILETFWVSSVLEFFFAISSNYFLFIKNLSTHVDLKVS